MRLSNNTLDHSDHLLIGKIVGTHGVKGALKITVYVESMDVFKPGTSIRARASGTIEKTYKIASAHPHKRILLVSFKEITDLDMAKELVGSNLFTEKTLLPELEEGTYYWVDLIGLSVFSADGGYIGRIESIMPTGSNDVYVVKNSDRGSETLIPALESVVLKVDIRQKTMLVDLPEGL